MSANLNDVAYAYSLLSEKNKSLIYELILQLVPADDEEYSEEEMEHILVAKDEVLRGDTIPFDELSKLSGKL